MMQWGLPENSGVRIKALLKISSGNVPSHHHPLLPFLSSPFPPAAWTNESSSRNPKKEISLTR